jgi:hypothetical protein
MKRHSRRIYATVGPKFELVSAFKSGANQGHAFFQDIKKTMSDLVATPTQDTLTRRYSDFETLSEALDYASQGVRGLNFHDMRGSLARAYP